MSRGVDAAGNKVGGAVDSTRQAAGNAAGSVGRTASGATGAARSTTGHQASGSRDMHETPKSGGGFWKWLLPLALAVLAWFGFKQLGGEKEAMDADVAGAASGVAESASGAAAVSYTHLPSPRDS